LPGEELRYPTIADGFDPAGMRYPFPVPLRQELKILWFRSAKKPGLHDLFTDEPVFTDTSVRETVLP
jgi:hypothetical protein